jgi:hypothetical protein
MSIAYMQALIVDQQESSSIDQFPPLQMVTEVKWCHYQNVAKSIQGTKEW